MKKVPTKNDFIVKFLHGDLQRFLKRIFRYGKHELIFSVILPKYEKQSPGITNELRKALGSEFPWAICDTINIHRVMVQYYGFVIDKEDIILCYHMKRIFHDVIKKYRNDRLKIEYKSYRTPKHYSIQQAKKELRARGFVKINDFDDYDKRYAHITTNDNMRFKPGKRLYFPRNFAWDSKTYNLEIRNGNVDFIDIYGALGLSLGVTNFTRILTPMNR